AGRRAANDSAARGRTAGGLTYGPIHIQFVYPAADGHVSITLLFGEMVGPYTTRLVTWVLEEGYGAADLGAIDWIAFGASLLTDPTASGTYERLKAAITEFTTAKTKAELFAEARRRNILLAPVTTLGEL